MASYVVTDIQKFSIHDGPGIRTTIFFKGCPLNCLWCHNPETLTVKPQIYLETNSCTSCKKCMSVCEHNVHSFKEKKHLIDSKNCKLCLKCIDICQASALSIKGTEYTVEELTKIVLKDKAYYKNSNGGVTLSGGEVLLQSEKIIPFLKLLKENDISIAIETTLHVAFNKWKDIIPYIDYFLVDYKHYDAYELYKYTKANLKLIDQNLELLSNTFKNIIIRSPIIPTINDSEAHFKKLASLSNSSSVIKLDLLPYHDFGVSKYQKIGMNYTLERIKKPTKEQIETYIDYLKKYKAFNAYFDNEKI